jgi:hypothetical protein
MQLLTRLRNLFRSSPAPEKWVPDSIYPDDVFIVSYPKSGNTWMRFLVGNYLTGNECTFENCHKITPDIHMNPERCSAIKRPRFIKSHAPYRSQYPNAIYMVRDGRDVAVSYYHYKLRMRDIAPDTDFAEFLESFNQGRVDPFDTWSDHVQSWLDQADSLLLVRYEDLQDDAELELRRVLEFSGVDIEEGLQSAVDASKFENMKEQEEKDRETVDRGSKSSERFMRKGKSGQWQDYFDGETHREFLEFHGSSLRRLGYVT